MREILITFSLSIILLSASAYAIDYYVDTDSIGGQCSNNNQGTSITAPWCTIGEANSELQAGDRVYIREGTYYEQIRPARSGSSDNYITYARYGDEEVTITGVSVGVNLENRNYIVIDGLKILDVFYWVSIEHSHHNIIKNCYMRGADDWAGLWMYDSDHHKILNNTFIGYCGPSTPQYASSDLVYCYGDCYYNVIEGNYFEYGAHASLVIGWIGDHGLVEYNVIRNNRVWNPWHTGLDVYPRADYTLIEGNILLDAGEHASDNTCGSDWDRAAARKNHAGIQLGSHNCIIRNNVMINNGWMEINSYPPQGTPPGPGAEAFDNRIYHNTFNKNYNGPSSDTYDMVTGNVFKNNLLYGQSNAEIEMVMGSGSVNYFINNNILGAGVYMSPDGVWSGTLNEDPLFVNEGAVSDSDNENFDPGWVHLQSNSPMIDAGDWLTRTTSAGSGTTIPVEDAGYFYDGWGIEGEDGDLIQLNGSTVIARITNVDYNNDILTVNRTLRWSAGDGVSLAYSGEAPDIGAYEYGSQQPPVCPDGSCNGNETCSSCPQDCSCQSPQICCNDQCVTPTCSQNSDCGSNPCKNYTCSNPGTCSASCSSQDITSCTDNDGCCPAGCDETNDNDCGVVPPGTNLALNAAVTTSNDDYGSVAYMVDGLWDEYGKYWAGIGSPNWVRVDLGQNHNINRIKVGPFGRGSVYYYDDEWNIKYSTSSSPDTWNDFTSVVKVSGDGDLSGSGISIINGDPGFQTSNDSYKYYEFTFDQVDARYVLFTVTAGDRDGDGNGDEIEVYGGTDVSADLNNDGDINLIDLGIVTTHFGLNDSDAGWNATADIISNGEIDIYDLVYIASRFT